MTYHVDWGRDYPLLNYVVFVDNEYILFTNFYHVYNS